jgi:ribosomal protein S18 acetylase RimI-like enzyme
MTKPSDSPAGELSWRALLPGDGDELARLERSAGRPPSSPGLGGIPDLDRNSIGGFAGAALVAAGWLVADHSFKHEQRIYLHDVARPGHAGGDALLDWLEARARQLAAEQADGRPQIMRIDDPDLAPAAIARYERHGFGLAAAEDQMRFDLARPIPAAPIPDGIRFESWGDANAARWHPVYWAAFRERPGFPGWDRATWEGAYINYAGFRPERSLLAMAGDQGAGYAVCAIDTDAAEQVGGELWVAQIGVHPDFRRCGLAGALLAAVLRDAREAGFAAVLLDVNVNNPTARSVYERMGFVLAQRFSSYRKVVASS